MKKFIKIYTIFLSVISIVFAVGSLIVFSFTRLWIPSGKYSAPCFYPNKGVIVIDFLSKETLDITFNDNLIGSYSYKIIDDVIIVYENDNWCYLGKFRYEENIITNTEIYDNNGYILSERTDYSSPVYETIKTISKIGVVVTVSLWIVLAIILAALLNVKNYKNKKSQKVE